MSFEFTDSSLYICIDHKKETLDEDANGNVIFDLGSKSKVKLIQDYLYGHIII